MITPRKSTPPASPAALPFAPGASPFLIKGTAYLGVLAFAATIPGGLADVLSTLPPDVRKFLSQRFLAGSRYDLLPMVPLGEAVARRIGVGYDAYVERSTQAAIDEHRTGVYRNLFTALDPEGMVRAIPGISRQYGTARSCDAVQLSPGVAEVRHHGVPEFYGATFAIIARVICHDLFRGAGAKELHVAVPVGARDGSLAGHPTLSLRTRITWRDASATPKDSK